MHDTYNALRHFADSWGLLAMTLFFLGVVLWTFRPSARETYRDSANIPLRNEDAPTPDVAPREERDKTKAEA